MVWETESAAVPQSFALIAGCSRLGDGFVLLAEGPEGEAYGLLFFDRDGKNMEIRSIHARGYAIAMACKQDTIHILLQAPADAGGAFFVLAVRRTGGQDAKKTVTTSADIVLSDLFAVGQNYLLSGSRYFGNKPPEASACPVTLQRGENPHSGYRSGKGNNTVSNLLKGGSFRHAFGDECR